MKLADTLRFRYELATFMANEFRDRIAQEEKVRAEAARRLHEECGLTFQEIADLFDLSRSRAQQLVEKGREQ